MSDHTANTVGIDISKTHLDAHELPSGRAARFSNDAAGFKRLSAWIGPEARCVAYESTGPWHRALEDALGNELPLARVNAMRARRFAQALGQNAKTDAVDAWLLATMAGAMGLRRVERPSAAQRDLEELTGARDALVKDRTAALNRGRHARHKLPRRQSRYRLAQIERQIKALDAEIQRVVNADEALSRKADVLMSMPGVARITAAGLIAALPELGRIGGKAASSLAGLAPFARESGMWKGRSRIGGGRRKVRVLLYMAALSAIRHNPEFARKYRELRDRGKPPKVALTAIMRKMLVLANTLVGEDRPWQPVAPPTGA